MTENINTSTHNSLPDDSLNFTPVPRGNREHGWSPARQKAFIEALAETASVRRAAQSVNMSRVSAYYLRNHPQGGEFKKAWDAALDCGLAHLKDIAFERVIEGDLEPIIYKGVLVGYRRRFSNSLLMFLLRQYGQDPAGKRVTVNYVRTRAAARQYTGSACAEGAQSAAESSVMTVRSSLPTLSQSIADQSATQIDQFSGVVLDTQAHDAITAILADCAARRKEYAGTVYDAQQSYVKTWEIDPDWQNSFEAKYKGQEKFTPFNAGEIPWDAADYSDIYDAADKAAEEQEKDEPLIPLLETQKSHGHRDQ